MKKAIETVNEKILAARKKIQPNVVVPSQVPRLVAVSKFKPVSSIIEAYYCGQRFFGENYIQELEDKSNDPEILEKCPEIKFHFIGHLQSNKAKKILNVKNLHMVETIDSQKLANLVDRAFENREPGRSFVEEPLKVLIQVNTSGEDQKNGVAPEMAPDLAHHIVRSCKHLKLCGVMTIGRLDGWGDFSVNQDFVRLYQVRDSVSKRISVAPELLEMSMGMSSDFEEAITMGSTNIRVGTMIFGQR